MNRTKTLLSAALTLAALVLSFAGAQAKQIKVMYREAQVPVMLQRSNNTVFQIRVESDGSQTLDSVNLRFKDFSDIDQIEDVSLLYMGVEAVQYDGQIRFSPVADINPGPSYSILIDSEKAKKGVLEFKADKKLFPGVNYFRVAVTMKSGASVLARFGVDIEEIKIDGEAAVLEDVVENPVVHRVAHAVRHAGDDGSAAYRIPGLTTTNQGTLLAVYDVRYNNSKDLQEYVDIGLSRSTDGGQTWEPMRLPLSFGEWGGLPKSQNGVGDPAILVDTKTNTAWVVAWWTHGMGFGAGWNNSRPGMTPETTGQLVMSKSTDDGKSWSEPVNVTQMVKKSEWPLLLQGPGKGITTDDGTLVFAIQYKTPDNIPNAGIMYSKDRGETWTIENHARTNTTEAQVAQLPDGSLMLNMRDNRGGSRAVSVTKDLGKTWEEHVSSRSALREPVCMASLISVKAEDNVLGKDLLIFSNPDSEKRRNNMTIKISLDNGVTWLPEHQVMLDEGDGWGYSCLTMIDKETVGILYESSLAHMTFQAIPLKDIVK